jgi:putative chitinase
MQLTAAQIKSIAPKARDDYVAALVNGGPTFEKYGFTTPMRIAQFLAQVCEETGGLTICREETNYSASNLLRVWPSRFTPASARALAAKGGRAIMSAVYGGRMGDRAGTDDGYIFRGGSFCQLTGRDSYRECGKEIGQDLENHPELIENADIGLQAACWELSQFISYMDLGERGLKAVSNGLNRGNPHSAAEPIGWAERQRWFRVVCDKLGVNPADATQPDEIRLGDNGGLVKVYQGKLSALGYLVGRADGAYGSTTRAAVLAFQAENGLPTDGQIGPQTRALLDSPNAKPMPKGDRATETAQDITAAGSTTMAAATAQKQLAGAVGTVGAVGALSDQASTIASAVHLPPPDHIVPGLKGVMDDFGEFRALTDAMTDCLHWATAHWYIGAVAVGYLAYRWGGEIIRSKLAAHNAGLDLSH